MEKYTVKHWISYCASILALSGILLLGSCGSEEPTTDEVYVPEKEVVSMKVEQEVEVIDEPMQETQPVAVKRSSSVNINRLLNEYPEVNQAIRTSLSSFENEENAENLSVFEEPEVN